MQTRPRELVERYLKARSHVSDLERMCHDCCLIGQDASMPPAEVVRRRLLRAQADGVNPEWMYREVDRLRPTWLPPWDEVKPA